MNEELKKHKLIYYLIAFVFIISIAALILSIAGLDSSKGELNVSFDKFTTIVEMIVGFLGVSVTVYFITMGITLRDYKEKLDENLRRSEGVDEDMRMQLKETMDVFQIIESVAGDRMIYIRLAKGRLLCKSKYSSNSEKIEGIRYIQSFYTSEGTGRSAVDGDVKILNHLAEDYEQIRDVRAAAGRAIRIIKDEISK